MLNRFVIFLSIIGKNFKKIGRVYLFTRGHSKNWTISYYVISGQTLIELLKQFGPLVPKVPLWGAWIPGGMGGGNGGDSKF